VTNALDFHPEKIPVADFPSPPGSGIRGGLGTLFAVVDRDGFIFLACCARHAAEGTATGWWAQREHGRILGNYEPAGDAPADCGRDTEPVPLTESDVGTPLDCGCMVTRANIPCGWHEKQYGVSRPDCGACQFGVPAVYHECAEG
jgi:hypothetical protein